MGRPTTPVNDVRIAGPLAPFAADFKSALHDAGYTPLSAVTQLRLTAHLSRWLEEGHLAVADLTGERVDAYLRARRAGHTELCTRRALRPLLDFLAARCVLPADPPTAPGSPADVVLASFGRYLRSERGLDASTAAATDDRQAARPCPDRHGPRAGRPAGASRLRRPLASRTRRSTRRLRQPDGPNDRARPRFTTTSCGVMSQA